MAIPVPQNADPRLAKFLNAWNSDTSGVLGSVGGAVKNWLVGGNATNGMPSQPATADYQRGYLQNDFMNRGAPTLDTTQSNQTRGQANQLAQMLFATANGTTPGAGEMAVQRGVNNGMAQNTAAAQMARGANAALAFRNAARANADLAVNGAGQSAIAQINDRTAAQNQLAQLLGTTRAQDLQSAGANQQSQLQQEQLQLGGLAQLLGVDQAALQQDLAKRGLGLQDKGMLGTLLQTGGQIAASAVGKK